MELKIKDKDGQEYTLVFPASLLVDYLADLQAAEAWVADMLLSQQAYTGTETGRMYIRESNIEEISSDE